LEEPGAGDEKVRRMQDAGGSDQHDKKEKKIALLIYLFIAGAARVADFSTCYY